MENNESETQNTRPFSIHVIGFGKSTETIITKTKSLEYDGVSAYMHSDCPYIIPGEKDIMAIFCVDEDEATALKVAKKFYDANILTIIISTTPLSGKDIDSATTVEFADMMKVVKSILDPLFLQGQVCFDFNDMSLCLHNSHRFIVENYIGIGDDDRIAKAMDRFTNSQSKRKLNSAEYISLFIYYNPNLVPPLSMREIKPFSDYMSQLPENVYVIWAIFHDNKMPSDQIRLSAILSGKELVP